MARDNRLVLALGASVAGVLLSTYLTYYTFTSGQSACELRFVGMPSCFYGLILYLLITIVAVSFALARRSMQSYLLVVLSVAGVGFSGYLTWYILTLGASCVVLDVFGVPPCILGLIMYVLILLISLTLMRRGLSPSPTSAPRPP